MNKSQFLLVLASAGLGFSAGASVDFDASGKQAQPSITFVHALRIERVGPAGLDPAGLDPKEVPAKVELLTVWRTAVTTQSDGGVDLRDLGAAVCTGDTAAVWKWAAQACPGLVENARVVEVRASGEADDIAVEIYGDTDVRCALEKPEAITTFLGNLACKDTERPQQKVRPL